MHVEVANDQSGHTGYTAASTTTVLQEETETEIWMDTDQQTTTIKLQKMFFLMWISSFFLEGQLERVSPMTSFIFKIIVLRTGLNIILSKVVTEPLK